MSTDDSSGHSDEAARQMPDSAVRIIQRGRDDVYIIPAAGIDDASSQLVLATPFEDGVLLGGAGTDSDDTDTLSVEYGAYQQYSLSDLSGVRDDHERLRDQIRYDRIGDQPREQQPDADVVQELIDVFVIVEHALKFLETAGNKPEQGRHYRRVSALCEDPQAVIENVEDAVAGTAQPTGYFDKLRDTVHRLGS